MVRAEGFVYLILDNVEPYLDGVRMHLRVGNPMSASYSGGTMHVTYGPRLDSARTYEEGYTERYIASLHKKTIRFAKTLRAGCWTKIDCVLSPMKPSEFGTLQISISTDSVSLSKLP